MTVATTKRLTFEEYLSYEDGTDTRYELAKGALVEMSLGTGKHGKITKFLDERFNREIEHLGQAWTAERFTVGIQSPRGNRWDTCRIPDITILTIEQWDDMESREAVIRAHEPPPLLVVEVVSPSTINADYREKRAEYMVLDIPEYWIVDPLEQKITVCILQDGAYDDQAFQGEETPLSPTFPDFSLTVQQILEAKRSKT
ncbi:MAG: Uma2 family endonuclease [Alkalinema sp. RL_2_19]|nr:Uma2 family endonuclease [Alkalinema sp. RL_2_19]